MKTAALSQYRAEQALVRSQKKKDQSSHGAMSSIWRMFASVAQIMRYFPPDTAANTANLHLERLPLAST